MKCDFNNCNRKAKYKVGAVFGMTPQLVELYLCKKHKNIPSCKLGERKLKKNEEKE
jgi:hypothetical protein